MKIALSILAFVIVLLLLPLLRPVVAPTSIPNATPAAEQVMPWQIELLADGRTRVFGLIPGSSRLADARLAFGNTALLAIVAPQGAAASLEVYFETVTLGSLAGKAILTLEASTGELEALQGRASATDHMATGIRKYVLNAADAAAAEQRPIRAITFIPAPNLDAQIILQRFGPPAERLRQGETLEHFLYPEKGLDVVLDAKGKELLQYVAPKNFASLRDPLLAASRP